MSYRPARGALHLPRTESAAVFSDDRRYCYLVTKRWGQGPSVGLIGWHPSTEHDPGLRRFKGFARSWGFAGYTAGSLYAAITADPQQLSGLADPIGPANDRHLDRLAATHDMIVFGWGSGADPGRARAVASRIWRQCRRRGGTVAVLDWTVDGQPCHPLQLPDHSPLHTLTAGAHPGFVDVDRRWTQLLADTADLDDDGPERPGAHHAELRR